MTTVEPRSPSQLWTHPRPHTTNTYAFKACIEDKYGVQLRDYEALRRWSIGHLSTFWEEVAVFTRVRFSESSKKALYDEQRLWPRPEFFPGARLNFAQNLLFPSSDPAEDAIAVFEVNESTRRAITWSSLRERVRKCYLALRRSGIRERDRVAGYVSNHSNALVLMLSATSIGAIWSGISPDSGVSTVLERLQQIKPKILFADNAVVYNGRVHPNQEKIKSVVAGLSDLTLVVILEANSLTTFPFDATENGKEWWVFKDFVESSDDDGPLTFGQFPADHPVYILYSSGTTGKPKCIVHGAIGTLIQHKKEHMIQCSMGPDDRFFYYTTCTWMMWHWLVSALATGVAIVLYDGSPFRPLDENGVGEMAMPRLIEELKITHFGTSAKYLSILEQKDVQVSGGVDLSALKAIYSTGSPLAPSTFRYVYRAFGHDLNLASITGGTDIISLFGAPSQISPVYEGEIQVRGLGMAVEVWDPHGQNISEHDQPGDLVCTKPFPCQPVMFWGNDGEERYHASYFETFPEVWHHGDFARISKETGGLVMLGRSDGVLKPGGVRFGSSEIYNVLSKHHPEIEDALCIGRRREHDSDEIVVLFLKMGNDETLTDRTKNSVRFNIKADLSARHVPGIIDQTPEIPVTTNGKKIEVAVKQILCGTNIQTSASVANPSCLEWYQRWHEQN